MNGGREQAGEAELFAFFGREGGALVEQRIVLQRDAALEHFEVSLAACRLRPFFE
jgi:hypothetical protein